MADEKLDRARDALTLAVVRHCSEPACVTVELRTGANRWRPISPTARSARAPPPGAAAHGIGLRHRRRVAGAGGGRRPPVWSEMDRTLANSGLELRYIDGTSSSPSGADALRDCAWAELLVVWAPTPLPHKVSDLYRADVCAVARRVVVHRRGIEALAMEVVSHLSARRRRRRAAAARSRPRRGPARPAPRRCARPAAAASRAGWPSFRRAGSGRAPWHRRRLLHPIATVGRLHSL